MQIVEDTRRFYDATAQETADRWYPNAVLLPTIREFLSYLPVNPRILDLGCGPGHESMRLAAEGATVLGLDFSPESIRIARERCPQCRFEQADFRELDTRFGTFDGVFASACLIHVSPAELPQMMTRIAEVLDEGGHLLALVREGEGVRESWPVIDGQSLRRVVYLYGHQALASATPKLAYRRDLTLAGEVLERGWRAHLLALA